MQDRPQSKWLVAFVGMALGLAASARPALADIAGRWSGAGVVAFAGGAREKATCRFDYRMRSINAVTVTGTCSTTAGIITQTANLRRLDARTYTGNFYNSQYGLSGSMRVVVSGGTQTVLLRASEGSARLSLRKN